MFDTDTVIVKDAGKGFEFDLNLLKLWGSGAEKNFAGLGHPQREILQDVGLKAVMYSTTSISKLKAKQSKCSG